MIYEVPIANKHLLFEKDFERFCEERGYELVDLSYHHNFKDENASKLRRDFSPASLSIRLNPDLLVQKKHTNSFFVELKTGNCKNVIQVEAYQLLQNKVKEKYLKTTCLYIYRGELSNNKMIACPAQKIRASKLVIPTTEKNHQVRPILENFYEIPMEEKKPMPSYSNDPYIEISDYSNWLPITEYMN